MSNLRSFIVLAVLLTVLATPPTASPPTSSSPTLPSSKNSACSLLKTAYPSRTFYSKDTEEYIYETQSQYWSSTVYESPTCVFVPENTQQVSFAIVVLTLTSTKFAVRGGGHMPIPGYNSIDSGVLLSTSNLTSLELSHGQSTVSIGAGNRWRDVYSYLDPHELAAVGGRVGDVGVSGFLLGGGISFYSSQYGFGSDTTVAFECVLASGEIIVANATNIYSDLFWALKGGGNSLCIVTKFVVKTVKSAQVWVGIAQYDQSQESGYLDAVSNFGKYGALDINAAIIPIILTYPGQNITAYAAAKFYNSIVDGENTTAFQNFTAPVLTPIIDSYALQSLSAYILSSDPLQPRGLRQAFRVMSCIVDREAIQYIHDTFLAANGANLSSIVGLDASVTFQPATKSLIEQSLISGGNPQGIDITKAPYFWMVENWSWSAEADDDVVNEFADSITAEIEAGLAARDVQGGFLYMNDAGKDQPVFQNYPADNIQRLQAIREKYDPLGVYTILMPGGWKFANV